MILSYSNLVNYCLASATFICTGSSGNIVHLWVKYDHVSVDGHKWRSNFGKYFTWMDATTPVIVLYLVLLIVELLFSIYMPEHIFLLWRVCQYLKLHLIWWENQSFRSYYALSGTKNITFSFPPKQVFLCLDIKVLYL